MGVCVRQHSFGLNSKDAASVPTSTEATLHRGRRTKEHLLSDRGSTGSRPATAATGTQGLEPLQPGLKAWNSRTQAWNSSNRSLQIEHITNMSHWFGSCAKLVINDPNSRVPV